MADDNNKRQCVSSADEDVITNLSEDLTDQILERLPIEDAVRTSVLSKKWRYRWTTIKTLHLGKQFSEKVSKVGAYEHNGFIRIINQIMIQHTGPIFNFFLHIPKEINLDSFQEVDQWMLILSRKSVRELTIINSNQKYQLPSTVFSCELRKLTLFRCNFNPPIEFQGFPNLEVFNVKKADFGDNLSQTVMNSPCLTYLSLDKCVNVNKFNIRAENLQTLRVVSCPDAMFPRLLHSTHLIHICLSDSIQAFPQAERFNLARTLRELPELVTFTIDGIFLKDYFKAIPHAINCLQQLRFQGFSFGDLDQVQGALCMLRDASNLKAFRVKLMQMGPDADLDLTTNYLESPDCLDQRLLMLRSIEMTSLEGTRPELLFIKLLLARSPHLEKIVIRPSATTDAQKMLNIAKDVMLFPRASRKAKMAYLDPEP